MKTTFKEVVKFIIFMEILGNGLIGMVHIVFLLAENNDTQFGDIYLVISIIMLVGSLLAAYVDEPLFDRWMF